MLAFILGIFCGLLPYHGIRSLLSRQASTRQAPLQENQLAARMQNDHELAANELYEQVNIDARYKASTIHPNQNTHFELKENVAYGRY